MTTCLPTSVFCSPDLLPRLRRQFPSSVSVGELQFVPEAAVGLTQPANRKRSEATPVRKSEFAHLSEGVARFAASIKMPGKQPVKAVPVAKPLRAIPAEFAHLSEGVARFAASIKMPGKQPRG